MFESEFEERLFAERLTKLEEIKALGVQQGLSEAEATYPNSFAATATIPEVRTKYIDNEDPPPRPSSLKSAGSKPPLQGA